MNIEDFKTRLVEGRETTPIDLWFENQTRWEVLKHMKNMFAYIEFNCRFVNGTCKRYLDYGTPPTGMCCCANCNAYAGYLDTVPEDKLGYYAKKFSKKTGFWRKAGGCNLPHSMRSVTCLTFHCNGSQRPQNEPDQPKFSLAMMEWKVVLDKQESAIKRAYNRQMKGNM